ncbi:MAG: FAD:protein FMN transferase [Acidobacteriota bacterium]|nr:FAD:protein FMN transferase [Acidobacteriota bacterium]
MSEARKLQFHALGTLCEVQYFAVSEASANRFEQTAVAWVQAFEAKYTRFRETSLIGRINAAAGRSWVEVDAEAEQFFKLCDSVYFLTQGAMDPTALPLLRLWNWRASPPVVPSAGAIAEAMSKVGWKKVQRQPGRVYLPEPGMALDFGGFGKEYAVDQVARIAQDCGLIAALVDFGHDLRAWGVPPNKPAWHIGLEDPKRPGTPAGSVALRAGKGIASSGDYLRSFVIDGRRYGHIVDPRTGSPVANGCVQATVIASTCLQAGILSTTAFILGVPKGLEFIQGSAGAEGILLTDTARAQTRGWFHYVVS